MFLVCSVRSVWQLSHLPALSRPNYSPSDIAALQDVPWPRLLLFGLVWFIRLDSARFLVMLRSYFVRLCFSFLYLIYSCSFFLCLILPSARLAGRLRSLARLPIGSLLIFPLILLCSLLSGRVAKLSLLRHRSGTYTYERVVTS